MISLLFALFGSALPASAGLIDDTLEAVGKNVPNSSDFCFGTGCFETISTTLVGQVSPIALIIGTIMIMIAGIKLLTSSSEDGISGARTSILIVAVGIILTVLSANGVLLSGATQIQGGAGALQLCSELIGVVSIFEGVAGFFGIIALAATGIKVLASFGGEDAGPAMRNAMGAFLFGAFLLMGKVIVFPALGLSTSSCTLAGGATPVSVVSRLLTILSTLLGYLQIGAILIIIVLAIMLIAYMGNEDQLSKLKSYLYRLAFGLIVISLAKVIVNLVILN